MTRNPALLYNLGRALGNIDGRINDALEAYRRFRAEGCPQGNCTEVDQAIQNLESRLRPPPLPTHVQTTNPPVVPPAVITPEPIVPIRVAMTPPPSPVRVPPFQLPPVPSMSPVHRYGPWASMGIGLLLGGIGLQQGLAAGDDRTLVNNAAIGSNAYTLEVEEAQLRMDGESTRAIILGAAGGAALLGGILWMVFRPHGHREETSPHVIQPIIAWNEVGLGGTF